MAKRPTRRAQDGRGYEALTELVVRLLSRETETSARDLRRRARIRGRSTTHEIDLWWEPEIDGVRRLVAFQCKDLARPVEQGEMLKFRAVLEDLDERPLGVFVARAGYQRGATRVAAMSNILRLVVDRVDEEDEDADDELLVEHTEIVDAEIKLHRDDVDRDSATGEDDLYGDEVIFCDADGRERDNLLRIAGAVLLDLPTNGELGRRTHRLRQATFIPDRQGRMHRVSSVTVTGRLVRDAPFARLLTELVDKRDD
jgi:hypothetical protein